MGAFEIQNPKFDILDTVSMKRCREAASQAAVMVFEESDRPIYEPLSSVMASAADAGNFVDAGHLPDKVIRELGQRSGVLVEKGVFHHPWGVRPWVLTHTWEADSKTDPANATREKFGRDYDDLAREEKKVRRFLYLVIPNADNGEIIGTHIVEFMFVDAKGLSHCALLPGPPVEIQDATAEKFRSCIIGDQRFHTPETASSAINPVMTAIMLMNSRGVTTDTFAAPVQKNAQLRRKGRATIPGYVRLNSADYVTAIMQPKAKRHSTTQAAGFRKSPVPHIRRGHVRHFEDGKHVWIRDMLIGTNNEEELSWAERHRSGYRIRH